jgi:hypothetical protein
MRCDQCGKSNGTVQEAWLCDPGGAPIKAWLHRKCEAAFLQQLGLIGISSSLTCVSAA